MRFLVTGANGFVGKPLCAELARQGQSVRAAVRSASSPIDHTDVAVVGAIDGGTNWAAALRDVDVVIHLAARVHVMKDNAADPLAEFLRVNMQGTENLAQQAAHAGVKRLVYVSSIKVNGESTLYPSSPYPGSSPAQGGAERNIFTASDIPDPPDPYAASKWQAEQVLRRIAQETGLEVVIVRPPLVYGPGVKGNLLRLLQAVDKGIPLPFASVRNARSLLYLGNLVDALIVCATHPDAFGQTYLISDGEDISTPELLRQLGAAMGHPACLLPCPPVWLKLAARLAGKTDQVERLLGSLQVDGGKIRHELGWRPPYTLAQGLNAMADWYCGFTRDKMTR